MKGADNYCGFTLTSSVISSTEGIWASDSLTGSNFAHVRIGRTLNIEFIDWQLADIHLPEFAYMQESLDELGKPISL